MRRISSASILTLVLLLSYVTSAYTQSQRWPIQQKVDLSSGFGDYRDGRFHAGLDIRTGGRVGRRLIAPVDGYVYRVKMSYTGSGKALYLMGDDGFIYVFYHLYSFIDPIDRVVKQQQLSAQRYYIDYYFPEDSLRVKEGEVIGFTGQTGVGAPHLHFEKRTKDNRPLNPLTHGYQLPDTIAPAITRLGFELVDSISLFGNLGRKMFREIDDKQSDGSLKLQAVPYFNAPFGLLVEGYDQKRSGGMKQTVYQWTVYLDNKLLYRTRFDTLDFATDRSVYYEYDYSLAATGEDHVRRLYHRDGDRFRGSISLTGNDGIIGKKGKLPYGRHTVRVVAQDCADNSKELHFDFVWGPPGNIFELDSTATPQRDMHEFFFSPISRYRELAIDTVIVLTNNKATWEPYTKAVVSSLPDNRLKVTVRSVGINSRLMMLGALSRFGPMITDYPFNGIVNKAGKRSKLLAEPTIDGLKVTVETIGRAGSQLHLDFYYQDSLLGREYPRQFFSRLRYGLFIPPRPQYRMVDEIDVIWSYDTTAPVWATTQVQLAVIGYDQHQTVTFDSLFSIEAGRQNLRRPIWISIQKAEMLTGWRYGLESDIYTVKPEEIITENPFSISCHIRPLIQKSNEFSGLGWLDKTKDKWIWLEDSRYDNREVSATSQGGGSFAALIDQDPPTVEITNLVPGRTVETRFPEIEFKIIDTLSGIRDDQSIDIRIDKKWMIPEFDPESRICKTRPVEPLENGEHHLAITVTDRAGQKTEQYLIFNVRAK